MREIVQKMLPMYREMSADIKVTTRADKTQISFSVSSEKPVDRWYGTEILSHAKGAIRLDRAKAGAMSLLFNHDPDDPLGTVTQAWVENNRLMIEADIWDTDFANQVKKMIDGGLRTVSIGYRSYVIEENVKEDTYTSTDWEPFEVSIVTVPADYSVGIGRNAVEYEARMISADKSKAASPAKTKEIPTMSKKTTTVAGNEPAVMEDPIEETQTRTAPASPSRMQHIQVNEPEPRMTPKEMEQGRKRAIETLCKANKLEDKYRDMWIGQGASLEEVAQDILLILEERGETNPQPASRIGLSQPEAKQFSLMRAIEASADNDWSKAGFELECSKTVARALNKVPDPKKFYVPFEVLQRSVTLTGERAIPYLNQRTIDVATAGAGGFLVSTDNVGFIEMLRNRSVAFRMGARRLSGLQGSITVPRQSAAATGYWLSTETTQITPSNQTFVQMAMSPKNVGAYTEISRQLLLQSSPGAEGIVTDDLAQVVALAADLAALEGSGAAGQPTGISNTSGIGSVSGTSLGYAGVLEFQTDVATSNVTPLRGGYVTTATVAAKLMQRFTNATYGSNPLWQGNVWDGMVSGFGAMTSNQLTADSMIFGDWQELVIGEWGVLEVEVNPYANFQAGIIGVRAIYSMDVGVRRPFAFSRSVSIT